MKISLSVYLYILTLAILFTVIFIGVNSWDSPASISQEIKIGDTITGTQTRFASLTKVEDHEVSGNPPEEVKTVETNPEETPEAPADAEEAPAPKPEPESEPEKEPSFILALPTDNDELYGDPAKFYMHTNRYVDGVNLRPWQAGQYGYVRNQRTSGIGKIFTRMHEGIDIKPVARDSRNNALDDVRAISDGTVVYVNPYSRNSNYGKYIVVKHQWPEGNFYSLSAHLASTAAKSGQKVKAGDVLGRLGYTGDGLDRERSHLHLELNFLISNRFHSHYGSGHKNYNGINMIGVDIGRLFLEYKKNPHITMKEFLAAEEPYYKVRTKSARRPGILTRHPWMGVNMDKASESKSWEITFSRSGVPLSMEPYNEKSYRSPIISWVKDVNTNHSYMTMGKLLGTGDDAKLSSKGHRFISLVSETF